MKKRPVVLVVLMGLVGAAAYKLRRSSGRRQVLDRADPVDVDVVGATPLR